MKTAFLSLGSNLGDREQNLREALSRLEGDGIHISRRSTVYETEPQGLREQPWFLNAVVEAQVTLFPIQLLHRVQKVEAEMGRRRVVPNGPRTIDIDILLFGNFEMRASGLEIPHPRLTERKFVLAPLTELAPDLRHPVSRALLSELLTHVSAQVVRKTEIVL